MYDSVFLGLGGNHDNSEELLNIALRKIAGLSLKVISTSSFYQSPPWGFNAENDFVNCVVQIAYNGSPMELLSQINAIETELGRIRLGGGYTSRPIDIDILYYGNQVINDTYLEIPHPRMYQRNFVLMPLNEIASHWIDPVYKTSILQLLEKCDDEGETFVIR